MGKDRHHLVQAAYLGLWSFTGKKGREGKIYQYDKENPKKGWMQTSVDDAACINKFYRLIETGISNGYRAKF